MKIGFIGLGIMGSRMAANLINAGYNVILYNRTIEKAKELAGERAKVAKTPYLAAAESDVVFTMLSTPEAVQSVALGEEGLVHGMRKTKVWVDCSTVNPAFSKQMNEIAGSMQFHFVDAPVAGSLIPAEKGELVFLAGGKKSVIELCRPLFNAMGKKLIHTGPAGSGSALKLVNNLVMGLAMYGVAEGLALAKASGITEEQVFELLDGSPIAPQMAMMKKQKLTDKEFTPEFPLEWLQKDLHLAVETAWENGQALPGTSAVKEIFGLAKQQGMARKDFTAIYEWLTNNGKG
ncbi:MAG: NAD(P)-dependent oxidoreductase [Bacteroidales bacterium]